MTRLTDRERYRQAAAQQARERGADKLRAYADWRAGRVIPHRITMALNINTLYGPDVDTACGTTEPAVDMWEAGTLYPTWPQLQALAELTGYPVGFFVKPLTEPLPLQTSARFHRVYAGRVDYRESPPVRCYAPEVVWATVRDDQR